MELVPSRNIGGDVGHRQILSTVREDQIETLMSCRRDVHTGTTCLQVLRHVDIEEINAHVNLWLGVRLSTAHSNLLSKNASE